MSGCANMGHCGFFGAHGRDEDKPPAVAGFIRRYCGGANRDQRIRK
jgi:hypothetical protein